MVIAKKKRGAKEKLFGILGSFESFRQLDDVCVYQSCRLITVCYIYVYTHCGIRLLIHLLYLISQICVACVWNII